MDAEQAASMTAMILSGASKDRAAARWGHDPEFSQLWDDISADIERQRQLIPQIRFDIPSGWAASDEDDGLDPEPLETASVVPLRPGERLWVSRRGYGFNVTTRDHGNVLFVSSDRAEAIAKAEELAGGSANVVIEDLDDQW